jgi:hypothetical protein
VWHFQRERLSWRWRLWSRIRGIAALVWFTAVGLFIAVLLWSVVSALSGESGLEQDQPDYPAECPNLIISDGAEC